MQNRRVLRQFVLRKLAKAPVICLELSALNVFVLCQGLFLWLAVYPEGKMAKKLEEKLQNILFNLLPDCRNEITELLTFEVPKNCENQRPEN